MSTSVGSTMEGRRSQSYETIVADTGDTRPDNRPNRPIDHWRTLHEAGPLIIQFHGMLEDLIKHVTPINRPGVKVALEMFEGYFGYFGKK